MWEDVSLFRGKLKDAKRPSPGRGLFAGHLGVSIFFSFFGDLDSGYLVLYKCYPCRITAKMPIIRLRSPVYLNEIGPELDTALQQKSLDMKEAAAWYNATVASCFNNKGASGETGLRIRKM